MSRADRAGSVDEFYRLLAVLGDRCGGPRLLSESTARSGWPRRGVYFFFEPGELRADGSGLRVVRVGTHGLRPSKSTLWGRLAQHKGTMGGRRAGGGNHRGSVFRLHVGQALLARGSFPEPIADTWSRGGSAPARVLESELVLERAVTSHIGAMPVLWLDVDDEPGPASDRGVIEAGAIALLSNLGRPPVDPPSAGWLGLSSSNPLISDSGLWNVRHVADQASDGFLPLLEEYINRS